jgi:hypothetical protein
VTAVVINNQAVARFTIQTRKTLKAVKALGLLDHKAKVDTNALTRLCSTGPSRLQTASSFAKLGMCTHRAGVKLSCNWNRRDTVGMLVHLGHTRGVDMAKALMPQDTELVPGEMAENVLLTMLHVGRRCIRISIVDRLIGRRR